MLKSREDGRSRKHVCFSEGAMHFYWVGLKFKLMGLCLELHFNFPERFVKSRQDCLAGCWIPKRFLSCRNPVCLLCKAFGTAACVLGGGGEGCVVGCPSRVLALGVGERPGGLQSSLTAWDLQRWGSLPENPGCTENFLRLLGSAGLVLSQAC